MLNALNLMKNVIAKYANNPKWVNAPLGGIKILSNTHVGKAGEDFIKLWCEEHNFAWESPASNQSPWDIRIESITFEIKTATEDVNGNFQFNHIRRHRDYGGLICLGIAPDEILFDAWGKDTVVRDIAGHLVTMDKGSAATFKLTKKPSDLLPITQFADKISEIVTYLTDETVPYLTDDGQ